MKQLLVQLLTLLVLMTARLALAGGRNNIDNEEDQDFLYIGYHGDNTVKRFDWNTGAFLGNFVSNGLRAPNGLIWVDGKLYVVNSNEQTEHDGEIFRYSSGGSFLDALVDRNSENAPFAPQGLILGKQNTLYVTDLYPGNESLPGQVTMYNSRTGAFQGNFDATGFTAVDMFHPRAIVQGPDGFIYVTSRSLQSGAPGHILRFTKNGVFTNVVASHLGSGCAVHLHRPQGIVFGPDGNIYVTAFREGASDTDKILIFNTNGQCLRAIQLTADPTNRSFAQALLFGPNGRLYVPITNTGEVRRYNATSSGNDSYDVMVPAGTHNHGPWFLTFRHTNPTTLAYQPS
jgi:glucose/arabinose dehydrogenase